MAQRKFKEFFDRAKKNPNYWTEMAILDFTTNLWRTMKRKGVSQAELARSIDTSPAYVSRVLGGNANFTIKSMVQLAHALGMQLRLDLREQSEWTNIRTYQTTKIQVEHSPAGSQRQTIISSKVVPIDAANDNDMLMVVNG